MGVRYASGGPGFQRGLLALPRWRARVTRAGIAPPRPRAGTTGRRTAPGAAKDSEPLEAESESSGTIWGDRPLIGCSASGGHQHSHPRLAPLIGYVPSCRSDPKLAQVQRSNGGALGKTENYLLKGRDGGLRKERKRHSHRRHN